jgi:hypothetical protein
MPPPLSPTGGATQKMKKARPAIAWYCTFNVASVASTSNGRELFLSNQALHFHLPAAFSL